MANFWSKSKKVPSRRLWKASGTPLESLIFMPRKKFVARLPEALGAREVGEHVRGLAHTKLSQKGIYDV